MRPHPESRDIDEKIRFLGQIADQMNVIRNGINEGTINIDAINLLGRYLKPMFKKGIDPPIEAEAICPKCNEKLTVILNPSPWFDRWNELKRRWERSSKSYPDLRQWAFDAITLALDVLDEKKVLLKAWTHLDMTRDEEDEDED